MLGSAKPNFVHGFAMLFPNTPSPWLILRRKGTFLDIPILSFSILSVMCLSVRNLKFPKYKLFSCIYSGRMRKNVYFMCAKKCTVRDFFCLWKRKDLRILCWQGIHPANFSCSSSGNPDDWESKQKEVQRVWGKPALISPWGGNALTFPLQVIKDCVCVRACVVKSVTFYFIFCRREIKGLIYKKHRAK